MVKLFNKFFNSSETIELSETSMKDVVKEIHNKVDWYALYTKNVDEEVLDNKLKEVEKIKKETFDYLQRREKIGFALSETQLKERKVKQKELESLDSQIQEINEEKQERKWINELRIKYPLSKFIHRKDADEICKKYNLALGWTIHYVGELPEKNLTEIEQYKKPEEALEIGMFERLEWEKDKRYKLIEFGAVKEIKDDNYSTQFKGRPYWTYSRYSDYPKVTPVNTFMIICPEKDLTQTVNHVEKTLFPAKDPIVLYPVKSENIFQVVTKWGVEASESVLLNPNNN